MKRLPLFMALTCLALAALGARKPTPKPNYATFGQINFEDTHWKYNPKTGEVFDEKGKRLYWVTIGKGKSYSITGGSGPSWFNARDEKPLAHIKSVEGYVDDNSRATLGTLYGKNTHQFGQIKGEKGPDNVGDYAGGTIILKNVPDKDGFPNWIEEKKKSIQKPTLKHYRLIVQSMTQYKPILLINMDGSTQIDLPPRYDSLTIRRTKGKTPSAKVSGGDVTIEVPEKLLDMSSRAPNDFRYLNTLVDYNVYLDDQLTPVGGPLDIGK